MRFLVRSLLARSPACLACNGTRVCRSSQRYGTITGAVFVAVRCQECGQRFPLPRHVARSHVTLYSRIPATAANKAAVERALGDALRIVPGDWAVEVRNAHDDDRWLVNIVRRPGGGTIRLSLVPRESSADVVHDRVTDALREEGLLGRDLPSPRVD
jgi:hypothetical protein